MAITSLFYNREIAAKKDSNGNIIRDAQGRRIPNSSSLIGYNLLTALENDNRAEAWFEIRYNSNGGSTRSRGIANRRYAESDLFGLYDSGSFTPDEAKEIMRMYTKHRPAIIEYEKDYSPTFPITDEIWDAKDYLETNFAQGVTIDGEVIVGAGLSTYAYKEGTKVNDEGKNALIGTANNDLIFGEKGNDTFYSGAGNDVIYGGEGNDKIKGGEGNDYIEGGAGNDIYYINAGDGTDTIEDKEGDNRVIVNDREIKLLLKQADGSYKNPDGAIKAAIEDTDLVIYDAVTGAKIAILNENFQDGDFGIHLLDSPVTPDTTNTILGDLAPVDFDPNTAGEQTLTDALGNIITDPEKPAPDTDDEFYDSAGNDRIEGGGGNDTIYASRGGEDWILGGSGRDAISSMSGNDIAEGNAGADAIMGGTGDDKVFGGNYGEMETLITEGETAPSINEKGDLVSGNDGNDLVYGSNANDALLGGEGNKRQARGDR